MNSFMLYRAAYADRILGLVEKERRKGEKGLGEMLLNYQSVGKLAGESWRMESQAVRGMFEEWQEMEKKAHEEAWPGYKYLPKGRAGTGSNES